MIANEKIIWITIELLRKALFNHPILLPNIDTEAWKLVYVFSVNHGVATFCFDAIETLPSDKLPPKSLLLKWALYVDKVEKLYNNHQEALYKLQQLLKPYNVKILQLKGLSLSKMYPRPNHRECGDIDFYEVGSSGKVDKILESFGFKVDYRSKRHSKFDYEGVPFENHRYFLHGQKDAENVEIEDFLQQEALFASKNTNDTIFTFEIKGGWLFFF